MLSGPLNPGTRWRMQGDCDGINDRVPKAFHSLQASESIDELALVVKKYRDHEPVGLDVFGQFPEIVIRVE